jgi:hypothetical protein
MPTALEENVSHYYKLSHLLSKLWETASLNTYDLCRRAITPEEATKKTEKVKEPIFEFFLGDSWPEVKEEVARLRAKVEAEREKIGCPS